MRFIDRNPGAPARAVAEATLLPSPNVSRILRSLERKGLITRQMDARDARGICLHLTPLARENRDRLRETWSSALAGIVDDATTLDLVNETLRRVEAELIARRRRSTARPRTGRPDRT